MIRYRMVAMGAGTGALARYLAASAIMTRFGGKFPLGTLVISVTTLLTERFQFDPGWRLLPVAGFLGGHTTFSSFEWETYTAVRGGELRTGMLHVVASVMLGYVAVSLGSILARR